MLANLKARFLDAEVDKDLYSTEFPSKEWIEAANMAAKYSPDAVDLSRHRMHHIFVYGEMKDGFPKHPLLGSGAIRDCTAFTLAPFSVYRQKLGRESSAIALDPQKYTSYSPAPLQRFAPAVRVKGELWAISPEALMELDIHSENGVKYLRRRVALHIPYKHVVIKKQKFVGGMGTAISETDEDYRQMPAWMYIGIPDYWNDHIDAGYAFAPVDVFESAKKKSMKHYAEFTRRAYDI